MVRNTKYKYDVCISFAGEDRELADKIAEYLVGCYINTFYDKYEQDELLAINLPNRLKEIYLKEARFCILIVSKHYEQKKWPKNVEFPAIQERIMETDTGDDYLIPIFIDASNNLNVSNILGRIDLTTTTIDEALIQIASKIIKYKYATHQIGHNKASLTVIKSVSDADVMNLICHSIFSEHTAEIRWGTFTPARLAKSNQFIVTLHMLSERLARESRTGTLRIYCLSTDDASLQKFVAHSREPIADLKKIISESITALSKIWECEKIKKFIRLQIITYHGFPCLHATQIGDTYFFCNYVFGQKQDKFNIYKAKKGTNNDIAHIVDNFFLELENRQNKEINVNWF